ncbi:MAG: tyrosine-type recombinase/integrase [Bradyrhizobium sp.]
MTEKRPKLANRVYWKHGAYHYAGVNGWVRLGKTEHEAYAKLAELHTAPPGKMLAVVERYERERMPKKAAATQDTQRRQLTYIKVSFGHMQPRKIKPSDIAKFHDELGQTAPVSANRYLALLSDIFRMAKRWGDVDENPCIGLGRHTERPRDRYITDKELAEVTAFGDRWVKIFCRLEWLTGQRESNLIRFLITSATDEGMPFPKMKGGKAVTILWSDELRDAYNEALAYRIERITHKRRGPRRVVPMQLLVNSRGKPVTVSGLQSGLQRMWVAYLENCEKEGKEPVQHFTLHDVRAKAGSDTGDEKMLGHTNVTTFRRVYDRKPRTAKPAK